jgi:hypothetical protein
MEKIQQHQEKYIAFQQQTHAQLELIGKILPIQLVIQLVQLTMLLILLVL